MRLTRYLMATYKINGHILLSANSPDNKVVSVEIEKIIYKQNERVQT